MIFLCVVPGQFYVGASHIRSTKTNTYLFQAGKHSVVESSTITHGLVQMAKCHLTEFSLHGYILFTSF